MSSPDSFERLSEEVDHIVKRLALSRDAAFTLWFLQSYLTDSEDVARRALTGGGGDKNIDAILIDEKAKQVDVVQCKFRQSLTHGEKRNDVMQFADIAGKPWAQKEVLETFYDSLDDDVATRFKEVVRLVRSRGFELKLFYVTTGKIAAKLVREAEQTVRQMKFCSGIKFLDHTETTVIFEDYLDFAPSVRPLILKMSSTGPVEHEGFVYRYDRDTGIESWVFTMSGKDVGALYNQVGRRLFARNIRGYKGQNEVNGEIVNTIESQPNNFWYYNNGITIVCNDARRQQQEGQESLLVDGAQVINGQQTTRTLSGYDSSKASVLVKVIKIPRSSAGNGDYDDLINAMVKATNWQNRIFSSDLISNDDTQLYLERELRKRGYQYIRKTMDRSERKQIYGAKTQFQIDKFEMAKAVAVCIFESSDARTIKEGFFEKPRYAKIFKERPARFYLSRVWLMRRVFRVVRSDRNRKYAKWLVLHLLWGLLGDILDSERLGPRFCYACENQNECDKVLRPLDTMISSVFRAAQTFYRRERGSGDDAEDLPTFFKRSKMDAPFSRFWDSRTNSHRAGFPDHKKRFEALLDSLERN